MREIKFRYRVQYLGKEEVITFAASISDIECRVFSPNPFGELRYTILSRDQFTGLLDKNGKSIYEGDVVKSKIDELGVVEYICWQAYCGFTIKSLCSGFYNLDGIWDGIEVIGNIYQNKELLSGDDKE